MAGTGLAGTGVAETEIERAGVGETFGGARVATRPGQGVRRGLRAATRSLIAAGALLMAAAIPAAPSAEAQTQQGFENWVAQYRTEAAARGVPQSTLEAAFAGAALSERALELDKSQPEFVRPIWEYIDLLVSDTRITQGRAAFEANRATLAAIEERYGVPGTVVAAIWGVESNFGGNRGSFKVIETLATLAYAGRPGRVDRSGGLPSRTRLWRNQLAAALDIITAGDIDLEGMRGSWAGAMGHTQFIPTSYQAYAVDFTGDGRRDIWADDPTDALASTANYLNTFGWREGQPWGFSVALPAEFDYTLLGRSGEPIAFWRERGVTLADGSPLPEADGDGRLRLPAGHRGPAFLTLPNFTAILRYNNAVSYALAVSFLSERIGGAGAPNYPWPTDDRPLERDERLELQEKLTELGFSTNGIDGILGRDSRSAIRRFQASNSMIADGYPSARLLTDVRRALQLRNAPVVSAAAGPATEGDVREMQALLNGLGFEAGSVDGVVGPRTRRAIEQFVAARDSDLEPAPSRELLADLRRAAREE